MKGLFCQTCNSDEHIPKFEKDGLYVCTKCGKVIGYLCSGCDRVYLENRLGRLKHRYVCKICGATQWGYTEFAK